MRPARAWREVLPDDGVGDIVAAGAKTSFCIIDLGIYDNGLPNFSPSGEFHSCSSTIQGLSVGWIDVYTKGLPGQSIDISLVGPGTYWLESEVDPDNLVLESDETNNITRIKVTIGAGPDAYEPNDDRAAVDARPEGGPNSPNLGPVGPQTTVEDLSISESGDRDRFRFYLNDTGGQDDFVRIDFIAADGDLDLALWNAADEQVGLSDGTGDSESVSLTGLPEGWYDAEVTGKAGATNTDYTLTLAPSENAAPSVTVTDPPAGDTERIHSVDTYTMTFTASDPDGDDTWVSVFVNTEPTLEGAELLPTSLNLDAAQGFYIINSADIEPGSYWVYVEVTDGGTVTGAWSEGTITFAVDPNCAHTLCDTGVALVGSCDPCAQSICDVDPYCCNNGWDSICVGEVASVCGGECTTGDCGDHMLINEVRSRGLDGGNDDFVELYNPTHLSVVLDGTWTVSAAKHSSSSYIHKWSGDGASIPPGGRYLIGGTSYTQSVSDGGLSSGITDAGSVRLRQDDTTVDAVCYAYSDYTHAAVANGSFECEGTPVNNGPHNNSTSGNADWSFERPTCVDSDDNAADFAPTTPSTPGN